MGSHSTHDWLWSERALLTMILAVLATRTVATTGTTGLDLLPFVVADLVLAAVLLRGAVVYVARSG